jgi:hypothetical protein
VIAGLPESKSDSLERFSASGVPPTSRGLIRFHGQKNGPSGDVYFLIHLDDGERSQGNSRAALSCVWAFPWLGGKVGLYAGLAKSSPFSRTTKKEHKTSADAFCK